MALANHRIAHIEDLPPVAGEGGDAVVFEGSEANAFLESMNAGTATAEYLREADRLYERLHRPEPANDLFRAGRTQREPARRFVQTTHDLREGIGFTNVADAIEALDGPEAR